MRFEAVKNPEEIKEKALHRYPSGSVTGMLIRFWESKLDVAKVTYDKDHYKDTRSFLATLSGRIYTNKLSITAKEVDGEVYLIRDTENKFKRGGGDGKNT